MTAPDEDRAPAKKRCARCGFFWPWPGPDVAYITDHGWYCTDLDACLLREVRNGLFAGIMFVIRLADPEREIAAAAELRRRRARARKRARHGGGKLCHRRHPRKSTPATWPPQSATYPRPASAGGGGIPGGRGGASCAASPTARESTAHWR